MPSFTRMEINAAHKASLPGASNCAPLSQSANFTAPDTMMPVAAAISASPTKKVASVSNLPWP